MTRLVFLDCETTGLDLKRHGVWEIGLIVRDPGDGPELDREYLFQVQPEHLKRADPYALQLSRFQERFWRPPSAEVHPAYAAVSTKDGKVREDPPGWSGTYPSMVADQLFGLLHGSVIVGSNVGAFDMPMLSKFMRRWGFPWTAYYHPIDTPDLVAGYLRGRASRLGTDIEVLEPPYRSSDLYRQIGIDISSTDARHTALGDARRERDVFDVVMGNAKEGTL